MTSSRASTAGEEKGPEVTLDGAQAEDQDAEFGGPEARQALERKLLRKLDLRMSILIVIYILNYVRVLFTNIQHRLIFRITDRPQ